MTVTTDAPDAPDAFEPFPEPAKRGRRVFVVLLLTVVLGGLLVAGGGALWYVRQVSPPGGAGAPVNVTVPRGTTTQRIGVILESKGVITSARAFRIYLKLNKKGPFQAGDYSFRRHQSFAAAIGALEKGPKITFERLTVPEGLTLPQIAERVGQLPRRSADGFLALTKNGQVRSQFEPADSTSLEGLLLPETYNFEPRDKEDAILKRMVTSFDAACTEVGCQEAQSKVGITPYQAVIVASMIERETRFDEERPKVAEVIYNRLARGEPLGIDATIIYALGKSAERNVVVLTKDLEIPSPYNTYKNKGLTPTPIAAPGKASLQAALNPSKGPLLFYVVTETDGHHSFATTLSEHNANIRKAQQNGVR